MAWKKRAKLPGSENPRSCASRPTDASRRSRRDSPGAGAVGVMIGVGLPAVHENRLRVGEGVEAACDLEPSVGSGDLQVGLIAAIGARAPDCRLTLAHAHDGRDFLFPSHRQCVPSPGFLDARHMPRERKNFPRRICVHNPSSVA